MRKFLEPCNRLPEDPDVKGVTTHVKNMSPKNQRGTPSLAVQTGMDQQTTSYMSHPAGKFCLSNSSSVGSLSVCQLQFAIHSLEAL